MAASGVCHSDLHVVEGEWSRPANVVLGHEGAGVVKALGPGVEDLAVGDLVVLAWTAPCSASLPCRLGGPRLCANPRGSGHRLAAEAAVRVDPRTPPEIAALVGCAVTTGVGAVLNTAGVRAGESVVVIGAEGAAYRR